MRQSHILFVSVQGFGHVFPALGVAEELKKRGHRITFVTTHHFREAIEGAGIRFIPYRSEFENFSVPDEIDQENAEEKMHMVYVRENIAILRTAEAALADDIPDLVVYDVFPFIAGRLLAARWQRPAVRTTPVFAANEHYSIWDDMYDALGYSHPSESPPAHRTMVELFAEYGVESRVRDFWDEIEDLNIVFVPRSFQPRAETFDERFVFVGPSYHDERVEEVWRPPADGSPVVVMSLGTQFNERPEIFRLCADAFADTPWHVVMAVGPAVDIPGLGPLPANVEAHAWIPFVQILKHATAFITHGTTGAVLDGLYWGCPLVILPGIAAQAVPSVTRAIELGLGHPLSAEDVTAEGLVSAVRQVVDDTALRERVLRMRDEIHQAGGPSRAADAIEASLAKPR